MAATPYQKVGNTILVTANVTPGTGNISPVNSANSFSKITGPLFVKVDNVDSANLAFLNWSSSNTVTATIANASSSGTGVVIQPKSSEIVQLQATRLANGTQTIYFAAASANVANLYITPVIAFDL